MTFIHTLQKITILLGGLIMGITGFDIQNAVSAENAPSNTETQAILSEKAQITTLPNGLTVYILPDKRFPLVSTRLYVKAGSAYEEPKDAGISHVLEHMVFKGTTKRKGNGATEEVEAAGGYINAATSFDYTKYMVDLPSKHWALGIDIVHDLAFNAILDATELASEKKVILAELQKGMDSPHKRIFMELHASALKGTVYSHPIIGYEKTIMDVTPESMRAYIKKYYHPQNMLLVVVGNINADEVLAESQKLFGELENSANMQPVGTISADMLHNSEVKVTEGEWEKVYLGVALPVPGFKDLRSNDINILSYVLGGDATSYLYKKYKYDKQLVDSINASNYSFERVGMLYFTVQLEAKNVPIFWKEFITDLASLKATQFSEKDIARALLLEEDSIHRSKATISGIASHRGYTHLFLGSDQGEQNSLTALANVNHKSLQNAIDTWLQPQRINVSVLAPRGVTIPDLKSELHALWPAKQHAKAQETAIASEKRKVIELGDGRKVILIPDATMPYTAVNLYIVGGDNLSDPNGKEQGLASLTADVLTSGTQDMTAPQIDEYLAERATGLAAGSGRQVFWVSSSQPARFNKDIFDLFAKILKTPSMLDEEITREKLSQIANIRSRDDNPLSLAFSKLMPLLYGEHPYGRKSLGDIELVEKYTRQDVLDFWEKQKKQPWVLSVAGVFDEEEVLAFARSLPKPSEKEHEISAPIWGKTKQLDIHMPGRDQTHYMLVFKTVNSQHPDAPALEMLQTALAGQSGLLFTDLRDKEGLGYTVTASQRTYPKSGFFFFYIGTEPEKLEKAHAGFERIIAKVQNEHLSAAEIQKAKNQIEGDHYRAIQSIGNRSSAAALYAILKQDLDFREKFIEKTKEVTAEDIRQVAKKYLQDAYVVKVSPEK